MQTANTDCIHISCVLPMSLPFLAHSWHQHTASIAELLASTLSQLNKTIGINPLPAAYLVIFSTMEVR